MSKTGFPHLILLLLLVGLCPKVAAQSNEAELELISQRVLNHIGQKKPEWKHEMAPPMTGSKLVVIHSWSGLKTVIDKQTGEEWPVELKMRVAITQYESVEYAHRLIKDGSLRGLHLEEGRKPAPYTVGDEGYKWGYRGSQIAFRKGRYLFFVSAGATPDFGIESKRGLATGVTEELAKDIAAAVSDI